MPNSPVRLEHVNLTVSDIDASIDFWREALGFDVRWRGPDATGGESVHVGTDDFYLAMFVATGGRAERAHIDYDSVGVNHFGFVVEDLDAALGRLRAMGHTPHLDLTYEPGRHVYFRDLDGHEFELVTYT